jgi:hypothetical protein
MTSLETNAVDIAARYIAAWNEPDQARRRALIAGAWTEDARYVDPLMRGDGHDGIDAMIAAVHLRFAGHRFALTGTPEGHNGRIRFSWVLGAEGEAPVAHGTDFALLAADGRLESVTGFLDRASA